MVLAKLCVFLPVSVSVSLECVLLNMKVNSKVIFRVIIHFLFCKPIRKDHDWPLAVQSSPLSMVTQQLNYTHCTVQTVSLPYSLSSLSSPLTHACINCNWCKFESLCSFSTCSLLNEVNFIKWNILSALFAHWSEYVGNRIKCKLVCASNSMSTFIKLTHTQTWCIIQYVIFTCSCRHLPFQVCRRCIFPPPSEQGHHLMTHRPSHMHTHTSAHIAHAGIL